ncbi:hypothetical protein FDP41_009736 [Naegleria fowleri]|uniref:Uncharacterized protein n=1 Tax=Naegleria fowleri TaxID=5763 RepID=A0A6A5BD87_NAEFO|nr:uncharacterized protein FDP41_009736 [Naegleria fowleri]KAF0972040.1 hypothetical protein FDP41_009736 [Naegleria fowleri]CAG4716107.1 unnamed protein product [Naegleria fowleri]
MKSSQQPQEQEHRLKQESNEDQLSSDDDGNSLIVLYPSSSSRRPSTTSTTACVTHHHSTKENSLNSPHHNINSGESLKDYPATAILQRMISNEKRMARTLGIKSASEFCFGRGHNQQQQHHHYRYRTLGLHSHPHSQNARSASQSVTTGMKGLLEFPLSRSSAVNVTSTHQQRSLSGIYGRMVKKCPVLDSPKIINTEPPQKSATTTYSPQQSQTTHHSCSSSFSPLPPSSLPSTSSTNTPTTIPITTTPNTTTARATTTQSSCKNNFPQTPNSPSSQRCSFDSKINMLFSCTDEEMNEESLPQETFKQPYSKPVTSIIFEEIDTDFNPKKRKQDNETQQDASSSLPSFTSSQLKFKKQKSIDEITAENMYESLLNQCRKNYIPQLEKMNALASELIESPNEEDTQEPSCEVVPILSRHQLDLVVGEKLCAITGPMTSQDKSIIKFIENNPINDFLLELLENKKFNGF